MCLFFLIMMITTAFPIMERKIMIRNEDTWSHSSVGVNNLVQPEGVGDVIVAFELVPFLILLISFALLLRNFQSLNFHLRIV